MAAVAVARKAPVSVEARQKIVANLRREQALRSFPEFVKQAFPQLEGNPIEWTPTIQGYCEFMQGLIEGWLAANGKATPRQLANVVRHWAMHGLEYEPGEMLAKNANVNMAPGTLKSQIGMVLALAWAWLHAPDIQAAFMSSNDEVVRRDSDACRELVSGRWYRETFGIRWTIRYRNASYSKWATTAGGLRRSRTVLSGVVGLHFDWLFVDDPDDAARVFNEADRVRVRRKWAKAIYNRYKHARRVLRMVMQQRVHAEDLSGHIRQQNLWSPENRDGWAVFCVPMEFNRGPKEFRGPTLFGWIDPRNDNGEIMEPRSRFPESLIADEKKTKGTHGYESQYNQNPESLDGGMWQRQWFRFFTFEGQPLKPHEMRPRPEGCVGHKNREEAPAFVLPRRKDGRLDLDWLTITVDATFGAVDPKKSSKVGLLVVGGKDLMRFVFDDRTKEMSFLDTCAAIRALLVMYPAKRVLLELKANGSAIVEQLDKDIREAKLKGPNGKPQVVVVEGWNPGNDSKIARARSMMPALEQGTVFLLDGAHWLEDFLKEVCVFPNAPHDDRVDALSQVIIYYGEEYATVLKARASARW